MSIFNKKENTSIINVIKELSAESVRNVGNALQIDNSIINNITSSNVGQHIINNYYTDLRLSISTKHNLKDAPEYILPKMNSILSCIEYNKLTDNMLSNGMSIVSSNTKKALSNKLSNEIEFYKKDALKLVKRYANKVDSLVKAAKSSVTGTDLFKIIPLAKMDILEIMDNKGYLNVQLGHSFNKDNVDLSWLAFNNDLRDMELNVLRDEEIKTLTKNDLLNIEELFNKLSRSISVEYFNEVLSKTHIKDINALTLLVLSLMDKYKVTNDQLLINYVNTAIQKLNEVLSGYNDRLRLNVINLLAIKTDDGLTEILVFKDTYTEYMSNNGSNKTIFGSIINKFNNLDANIVYGNVTINDLNINKDNLINIYETKINNLNLELKNKSLTSLRSYYVFSLSVIDGITLVNKDIEIITEYINSLDLGTLIDTKNVSLNVFRYYILKETNFNEFMKGFEEADIIINDAKQDTLILYAAYRLVILYLINQTTLINK